MDRFHFVMTFLSCHLGSWDYRYLPPRLALRVGWASTQVSHVASACWTAPLTSALPQLGLRALILQVEGKNRPLWGSQAVSITRFILLFTATTSKKIQLTSKCSCALKLFKGLWETCWIIHIISTVLSSKRKPNTFFAFLYMSLKNIFSFQHVNTLVFQNYS